MIQKETRYLGTELLHDPNNALRYITIDRWKSSQDYEAFLLQWSTGYAALNKQCEKLMEQETLLGKWESIFRETG